MFKLSLALCVVGALAANNAQLPNHYRVAGGCNKIQFVNREAHSSDFVPSLVSDCKCLPGYQHVAGVIDCKLDTTTCPANSVSATRAKDGPACACQDGYVMIHDSTGAKCHYAYLFHIHGRMWLSGINKQAGKELATSGDFAKAVAGVIKVPAADVLPYHVYQVASASTDAYQMGAQHQKILIKGRKEVSGAAVAIAFAIREGGSDENLGYQTVHTLDSADSKKMLTALRKKASSVQEIHTMVWALQSEMWKPAATHEVDEACQHDYQCKGKLTCATVPRDYSEKFQTDKVCRSGYAWVSGTSDVTQTPTLAPTAPPTKKLPDGMASLSFDIEFGCGDPILTAQNLGSPTLKEDIEESIQKNLVLCPLGETCNKVAGVIITNVQDAVDFHRAEKQLPFQLKYTKSSGDDKITGSIVSIDIHGINGTHSRQTVSDLIKMLADPTERASIEQAMYSDMSARFGSNPLGSISDRSTCIMIHENTMDVQITEAVPTPAPRFMGSFDDNEKTNLHPETEGIYDCSCGTVMEINMGARFVSSVNLMKPVMHHNEMTINVKEFLKSTRNNLADYLKTAVPEAGVENCYINAVPIPVGQGSFRGNKGFTIRGPHKQEDGGKWTAKGFDYDYQFTVVVEGMNMNTGNDVFNALKKDELADKLNVAMYGANTRSNLMFGKDHATKWHTSGDITQGDVTVNGTKERWIPYFNETSFYKVQPSSIQLAFKEGNCEAIKAHIPHMEERPVIADCQYSGFGSAEWTAADKPCVNDGETAEQHRFQFVTELNQGPACTTENTALPICTVDLKANNIACRECSKQCAVDPAFYRESRQATGVKQCKNDCSAVIGEWMDGDLNDPSWGEVKPCTQNGCDDWNEVTCRSPDGMKANCQQQVNTNKRVRSRKLTWGPQWNRYSAWKAMTEAERKIKDPNFDNCADWKVYPKKQTIACAVGQECAIDCVRSTHFSEGQCNGECTCPKDDSGNFLSNCNGKSGSADLTSNTMTYTFHIETPAAHKGKECKQTCPDHCRPESTDAECLDCLEMKVPCNQQLCPTICHMSPWSDWGSCSQTCGPNTPPGTRIAGAKQERVRSTVPSLEEAAFGGRSPKSCGAEVQTRLCALHPCGSHVCANPDPNALPLTCTYDATSDIVYTHHVNDVHDNELFMCYHNHVTEVCTCLCWQKAGLAKAIGGSVKKHYSVAEHDQMITALHSDKYHASDATSFDKKTNTEDLNKFLPDTAKSGDTFYNSDGQAVKMP